MIQLDLSHLPAAFDVLHLGLAVLSALLLLLALLSLTVAVRALRRRKEAETAAVPPPKPADAESLLALTCFAVTATLYWNLRAPKPQRLLAAYLLSALAFLAKGPAFLLFTWPAYLWHGRGQHGPQARWHVAGFILFLPLALSWYAAVIWNDPGVLHVFFKALS